MLDLVSRVAVWQLLAVNLQYVKSYGFTNGSSAKIYLCTVNNIFHFIFGDCNCGTAVFYQVVAEGSELNLCKYNISVVFSNYVDFAVTCTKISFLDLKIQGFKILTADAFPD